MRRDQLVAATQRTSANSKLGILHLYGTTNVKRIGHIIFCLINMPINFVAEIQFYCNQHRRHCILILRRAGAGGTNFIWTWTRANNSLCGYEI